MLSRNLLPPSYGQEMSPEYWYPTTILHCHNPEDQNLEMLIVETFWLA
jgi:hypothetical protein